MTVAATDALALAQGLIRCKSVTPEEGGALALLEGVLRPSGFVCHRLTMTEPGIPDVQNLYARLGTEARLYRAMFLDLLWAPDNAVDQPAVPADTDGAGMAGSGASATEAAAGAPGDRTMAQPTRKG